MLQSAPANPANNFHMRVTLSAAGCSTCQVDRADCKLQVLKPTMESFEGAVMVADISGFTRLTEQLSRGSQAAFGVELLTKCMNNYFSKVAIQGCTLGMQPHSVEQRASISFPLRLMLQVIDLIATHGGDVMKFAGLIMSTAV
jgi:class 3 adenylate cyclase